MRVLLASTRILVPALSTDMVTSWIPEYLSELSCAARCVLLDWVRGYHGSVPGDSEPSQFLLYIRKVRRVLDADGDAIQGRVGPHAEAGHVQAVVVCPLKPDCKGVIRMVARALGEAVAVRPGIRLAGRNNDQHAYSN